MKQTVSYLTLLAGMLGVVSGCSLEVPKQDTGQVKIVIDEPPQLLLSSALRDGPIGIKSVPSTTSDFTCFTVNVTGSGIYSDPRFGANCTVLDNMRGKGVGISHPPVARGNPIILSLPPGKARTVDVYGIYPPIPECSGDPANTPLPAEVGGYFLGSVTADIVEPTTVTIPVSYNAALGKSFNCLPPPPPPPPGAVLAATFGTGVDGNVTLSAGSHDLATTSIPSGRVFLAARNVSDVNTSDGMRMILSTPFTTSDFRTGDEVMWMVMGAGTATDCSTTPGDLYRGKWGLTTLSGIDTASSAVMLGNPIVSTPATLNNAAIGATLVGPPNTFCSIQMLRVPHFDNLTLDTSGGALTAYPQQWSYSSQTGGVVAFRVKNTLNVTGPASPTLLVSGKGFGGGSASSGGQGDSPVDVGSANFSGPNGPGGGGGAAGGGGGAGGPVTAGGAAAGGASGGSVFNCQGPNCVVMGSGGGSSLQPSGLGGTGGGVAFVWAKNINVSAPSLRIFAKGDPGGTNGAGDGGGGGAGGYVFLTSQTSSSLVEIYATGGTGGGASNFAGGGGSGGAITVNYCSGSPPSTTVLGGAGGIGTNGNGAAGGVGIETIIGNSSAPFCSDGVL